MIASVCICTRNRPGELRKAIASVIESKGSVQQIVVSDDSTDNLTEIMVKTEFPDVTYVKGHRRGLGANRNVACRHATGTHVLFIDDDVILNPNFFDQMAKEIDVNRVAAERIIFTGTEITNGEKIFPHKQSFLGFQSRNYEPSDKRYSIVINATIFPRRVFNILTFDENLVYGYEEIDFSARAVLCHGFSILLVPDAFNFHHSSPINRDYYEPFTEASRIYVTFKKYWWMEHRHLLAGTFLILAYIHNLMFCLKKDGVSGFSRFTRTLVSSMSYVRLCFIKPVV